MIPDWAARDICDVANLTTLDMAAIEADAARTLAPILSLTRALATAAGPAGDYVHWGATTQNVMQTGRILLLRKADAGIRAGLARAVERMGHLAADHADTLMAGRTNRRHALPITFGFKVAGWIEEMERATDRVSAATARMFALPFGGAVGAMHAYGTEGRTLYAAMARDLDLRELLVAGRAVNDLFADYVLQLCLLAMTTERIAAELYRLMAEETGEVIERLDSGTVGSSTMPQKVNPKFVVKLLAQTAELRGMSATALEIGLTKHEGDAVANQMVSALLDRAVPLAWRMADGLAETLERAQPVPAQMASNLRLTDGGIAAEGLMMTLAPRTGRAQAHDILHHALETGAQANISARTAILADPSVADLLTADQIEAALDPANYTGVSSQIAQEAAVRATDLARRLRA